MGEREVDEMIKPEKARDRDDGGNAVIDIDGADKIPLLALILEIT